jgi:hypothetical protein
LIAVLCSSFGGVPPDLALVVFASDDPKALTGDLDLELADH